MAATVAKVPHYCRDSPPATPNPSLSGFFGPECYTLSYLFVPTGQVLGPQAGAPNRLTLGHVSNLSFWEEGRSTWPFSSRAGHESLPPSRLTSGIAPN